MMLPAAVIASGQVVADGGSESWVGATQVAVDIWLDQDAHARAVKGLGV
jgi:hypothetical protein